MSDTPAPYLLTVMAKDLETGHRIPSIGPYGVVVLTIAVGLDGAIVVEAQCRTGAFPTRTLEFDPHDKLRVMGALRDGGFYEEKAKWDGIATAGKNADERMAMLRHSKAAQWVSDMRILCGCQGCVMFPSGHQRTCVVHVLLLTKVIPRTYMDRRANKSGAAE